MQRPDSRAAPGPGVRAAAPVRPDGRPARVLVVDDEPALVEAVATALTRDGWTVRTADTGARALDAARAFVPDVVVLDVMLPDADGVDLLARLRGFDETVAVLFLTARDGVADRIAGITAGGDDYVTKPFSLDEVVARLRGLLRRSGRIGTPRRRLQVADLVLDEDSHDVHRGGDPVALTATEYELLRFLLQNPDRVLSKTQILQRVWKYDFGGEAHVVELYISYLRKKVDAGRVPLIHTVRGAGYLLRSVP